MKIAKFKEIRHALGMIFSVREAPGADVPARARAASGGGVRGWRPVVNFEVHTRGIG